MTSGAPAFLALWNDVDPVRDAEYNIWHTYEHVPERVGVAGIVAGRRYHARERRDQRYFTRYDLDSLTALNGPAYADVVENPTAWSRSMRPSLRNFLRQPCAVVARLGGGLGGSVVTIRFSAGVESSAQTVAAAAALLPWVGTAGITAIVIGRVDAGAAFPLASIATAAGANGVALVDGLDRAALEGAAPQIAAALHDALRAEAVTWKTYDLAFVCTRSDLADPSAQRQPPREDLRRQWQSS